MHTPETVAHACTLLLHAAKAKGPVGWTEVEAIIADGIRSHWPATSPASPVPVAVASPEAVWAVYPRKVGKKAALKAILRACDDVKRDFPEQAASPLAYLLDRVTAYKTATDAWSAADRQYIPHPSTWFNQGRYQDAPAEWARTHSSPASKPRDYTRV